MTKSTAAPAAPGGVPAPSSDVDSAAAKKKRFWRTTLADLAREGAAKNTSFGRKLWIAVCVAFPALYAALTIAKLT